jgi:hypothetical protein
LIDIIHYFKTQTLIYTQLKKKFTDANLKIPNITNIALQIEGIQAPSRNGNPLFALLRQKNGDFYLVQTDGDYLPLTHVTNTRGELVSRDAQNILNPASRTGSIRTLEAVGFPMVLRLDDAEMKIINDGKSIRLDGIETKEETLQKGDSSQQFPKFLGSTKYLQATLIGNHTIQPNTEIGHTDQVTKNKILTPTGGAILHGLNPNESSMIVLLPFMPGSTNTDFSGVPTELITKYYYHLDNSTLDTDKGSEKVKNYQNLLDLIQSAQKRSPIAGSIKELQKKTPVAHKAIFNRIYGSSTYFYFHPENKGFIVIWQNGKSQVIPQPTSNTPLILQAGRVFRAVIDKETQEIYDAMIPYTLEVSVSTAAEQEALQAVSLRTKNRQSLSIRLLQGSPVFLNKPLSSQEKLKNWQSLPPEQKRAYWQSSPSEIKKEYWKSLTPEEKKEYWQSLTNQDKEEYWQGSSLEEKLEYLQSLPPEQKRAYWQSSPSEIKKEYWKSLTPEEKKEYWQSVPNQDKEEYWQGLSLREKLEYLQTLSSEEKKAYWNTLSHQPKGIDWRSSSTSEQLKKLNLLNTNELMQWIRFVKYGI